MLGAELFQSSQYRDLFKPVSQTLFPMRLFFCQEHRLKVYKQSLELILQDYYKVCQDVPAPLYKLLTPHMDSVLHYLLPGVSTLNWSSMNIDAYLHQVHSANARLKDVVDSVKQVVSEGIEKKIEEIRRVILFDKKLANSRVWIVERFVEDECNAVSQQGNRLHEMVKEVENALQVNQCLT